MTRLVTFADGFTAATPPDVTPGAQENFVLLNNQAAFTNFTGLILDSTRTKSVFFEYELERHDDTLGTFRQQGTLMIINGVSGWEIQSGNYIGINMLNDTIVNPQDVIFTVDSVTGQMQYKSGNMSGANYLGNLKTIITRVLV
jgi:hypothetical protein